MDIGRRPFLGLLGGAALAVGVSGCDSGPHLPRLSVQPNHSVGQWLAQPRYFVAHRGGDADWTQATAYAYQHATAWNPLLALEVPTWRTADGVWVLSESSNTSAVFGSTHDIRSSTWAQLSRLKSIEGGRPMARLVDDVLKKYGRSRILFVDNKSDADPAGFLAVLAPYGGPDRVVLKSYCGSSATPAAGRRAGYRTWGYYYENDMGTFAATQSRFDLLGLTYSAPQSDFDVMHATGKAVIAHVVPDEKAAETGFAKGARGLMVSGVTQVVEHARAR